MTRFGLIGYPIEHSSSPELFSRAYDGQFQYDLIPARTFQEAWNKFLDGYDAVNVTSPFKQDAYLKADLRSPEADKCSAANILVKTPGGILAHNSDYLAVRFILSAILHIVRSLDSPINLPFASLTSSLPTSTASRSAELVSAGPLPLTCPRVDTGFSGESKLRTIAVVGTGGAGRAARAAAEDLGMDVKVYRHNEIEEGIEADIVVYALPKAVAGIDKIKCRVLLEANYKDPCLRRRTDFQYISGKVWLREQARLGYELMTGKRPKAAPIAIGGFMGSGKTTIGKILAQFTSREFVDLDDEVEKAAGKSIQEIFSVDGEPAFRALELECLKKAVEKESSVIALGGGTFTIPGAKSELISTEFVYLQTNFETVLERLSHDSGRKRPLYAPETIEALYKERQELLNECIDSLQ